jgi:hypothetical protein
MIPINNRIASLVVLATLDAPPGTTVWVDSEGCKYEAVPTYQAATNAIAGPSDLDPISWQPVTIRAALPTGGVPASYLTRAAKTAVGSGVVSLTPGATSVPLAADVAAGLALLKSSVLWGSSVASTKTVVGKAFTQAELIASAKGNLGVVADPAVGADPTSVVLIPDTTGGPPANHYVNVVATGMTTGKRFRVTGFWAPNDGVQSDSLVMWTNGSSAQVAMLGTGALSAGSVGLASANGMPRHWKRADGIHQFCEEVTADANGTMLYFLPAVAGTISFVGNGTSGIRLWGLRVEEILATAVENLSDTGTCTMSSTTMALQDSICPEDGWSDGTDCFKFWGISSRTIAISATGYGAISGTAQPFTLVHVAEPYQTPTSTGNIWAFAGASSVALTLELTTADRLRVTRVNAAGTTVIAYFTTIVGHVPCIYEVVCDGTNALLYRQGVLVETLAFSLAGTTTFTSGVYGGQLPLKVAEFALFSSVLTAAQCLQVATCMGVARSVSLAPVPVLIGCSQSNGLLNGFGAPLANTGAGYPEFEPLGSRKGAIMCLLQSDAEHNQGWGRSRFLHWTDWADAATPKRYDNSVYCGGSMYYNWQLGFHEVFAAPVATITHGIGGTPIADFMSGGARNAAFLADIDAALASLGLPYYVAGVVFVFGEDDGNSIALADIFGRQMRALADELGTRYVSNYVAGSLPLVFPMLSPKNRSYAFSQLVIARERGLVASDVKAAASETSDLELSPVDGIHYYGISQHTAGKRLAEAINSLGGL